MTRQSIHSWSSWILILRFRKSLPTLPSSSLFSPPWNFKRHSPFIICRKWEEASESFFWSEGSWYPSGATTPVTKNTKPRKTSRDPKWQPCNIQWEAGVRKTQISDEWLLTWSSQIKVLYWEWGIWAFTILNHFHLNPPKCQKSPLYFPKPSRKIVPPLLSKHLGKKKHTAPPRQTKTEELPLVAVSSSLSISPRGKSKSNMRSAFGTTEVVEKMWRISGWFLMEPL